jgi:hypothetical protein
MQEDKYTVPPKQGSPGREWWMVALPGALFQALSQAKASCRVEIEAQKFSVSIRRVSPSLLLSPRPPSPRERS